jgi:hypothetical protein
MRDEIIDLTGAESWEQVEEFFGDMDANEIEQSVEDIWPREPGNKGLIASIIEALLG